LGWDYFVIEGILKNKYFDKIEYLETSDN
jgi:hypothetical protein